MFNKLDQRKNECMLTGSFREEGYDWWWHSFTARKESTGEEKSFFIEYFLCNPAHGQKLPVLGQEPQNKELGMKPSYLMVKAGCWGNDAKQVHRFYGWDEIKVRGRKPFQISAEECLASETHLIGHVKVTEEEARVHSEYMCEAGEFAWDLQVDKQIAFNVGYGTSLICRLLKAFEMYWHAEGMKTLYSGFIMYNGEKYIVEPETCYGYADKNWGKNFTSPWVWLSSNCMVSNLTGEVLRNSAFDIGGGCPKVFGIPLKRKLLGAFCYEGMEYEFNFSKFWTMPKTKFECKETDKEIIWRVYQESKLAVMKTQIRCKKADMLLINYEAPDGTKRHNLLWNGGTGVGRVQIYQKHEGNLLLIDDLSVTHVGCEYGVYDR